MCKDYKVIDPDFSCYGYFRELGYTIKFLSDCSCVVWELHIALPYYYPYITNYGGEKEDKIINELVEKGYIEEVD